MQIQNYANAYQDMSDEELGRLAFDREHLTPEAQLALDGELARRNLKGGDSRSSNIDESKKTILRTDSRSLNGPAGAGQFVEEVIDIYGRHFWFFFKLTLPAVTLSWVVGIAANFQLNALMRQVLQGRPDGHYGIYVFGGEVVSVTRYLITWIVFSLLFGGLCIATRTIQSGGVPRVRDFANALRSRIGPLLQVSLLLFGIGAVVVCIAGLAVGGVFWLARSLNLHSRLTRLTTYGIVCAAFLILSRFGLAIPAAMLDGCRPWQSVFRSDELTENKWLVLAALLVKSGLGGYLAGMAPFWLASFLKLQLPSRWILASVSVAAVSAVEPIAFIGFALLYLKTASSSV